MAVVAPGIVVIVAWLYTVADTMIGKIQSWYKRHKWNKLPIEERERRLKEIIDNYPNKFPLNTMIERVGFSQGKLEYLFPGPIKPPRTSQETRQTPPRPHDESPPE